MGTALQFGAGNIGRGFLAQLFHESGLEVVFVDVAEATLAALNTQREYTIHIVGPDAAEIRIDGVRAVSGWDQEQVAAEIATAEILCTAVGAVALPLIAPTLAAGLEQRYRTSGRAVNILLCENLYNAASLMREAIATHLPESVQTAVLERVGFVQAVVSRMVPLQTEEDRRADPLGIKVEAYKHLPIDADAWIGAPPAIVGMEPVTPFAAYVERKLYTHNCAHAVLGYLGYAAGHRYGYEALGDPRIASLLKAVLDETGQALIRKHGFAPDLHAAHVADLLARFQNRELGDTCRRLARDPIRKLAPDDRLIGAARCCEAQGVAPRAMAWAIAAALRYDDAQDPSAPELQRLMQAVGRERTLKQICDIHPGEPLAALIEEAMDVTARGGASDA